jgi:hippurate hydrolase
MSRWPELEGWQEDLYRSLHRHPELSGREDGTSAAAAGALREAGYALHQRIGGTGVIGILRNGDGPTVLMRAETDGLPMRERSGLPYASIDHAIDDAGQDVPVAHACGHDVHIACLLTAARLLANDRAVWRGTFVPLLQPAEELGTGAAAMVAAGLTTLIPRPDVAFTQHVTGFPAGTVGTRAGLLLSAAASLRITGHGRGAHGAMPHLAIDPIVLASMIVVRLQAIVAREVAPGEFALVSVGRIAAGTKSNIIPEDAVIELTVRANDQRTLSQLMDAIERVVNGECVASGTPTPPGFERYAEFPLTRNDDAVTAKVAAAFGDYFGDSAFVVPRQSASDDFSNIPAAFGSPYTYWVLGGIDPTTWHAAEAAGRLASDVPSNHSPAFAPVPEPTLRTGTAAIVVAAMAWLAQQAPSRRSRAHQHEGTIVARGLDGDGHGRSAARGAA